MSGIALLQRINTIAVAGERMKFFDVDVDHLIA